MNYSLYEDLVKLNLTSSKSEYVFHLGTRDNENITIYRDKNTGIIFSKDYFVGNETYEDGNFWIEKQIKENKGSESPISIQTLEAWDHQDFLMKNFRQFFSRKTILDFGCGHGHFLKLTLPYTRKSIGVELNKSFRNQLKEENITSYKSLNEIKDNSIDTIFMLHSFEHIPNPLEILKLVKKKLKKSGKLIIEVPHANDFLISYLKSEAFIKYTLWSQHLILHTRYSLKKFLEHAGFKDIYIKNYQRYPLSNHLGWLLNKRPGGHTENLSIIDSDYLHENYSKNLASIDATDTIFSIASS